MNIFIDRIVRAAKLDVNLYEEAMVEHDYLNQSIYVIILSSLSAGIGSISTGGVLGFIFGIIIALLSWLLWAYLTFFIANQLIPTVDKGVDFKEVIRITGFTSAPGLIRIFGIIPGIVGIVFLISGIWMLITMIIAIRHAFDFETPRAIGVCIIGWLIQAIALSLFLS
jgi:hypothetical protein